MKGAATVALLAALAACSHVRHVPKEEQPKEGQAKEERPESPAAKGAPPAPGRPPVPAAPEALLEQGAVGEIQGALSRRGLLKEHREGELDAATSAALRRFQRGEGLAETGFPDRETLRRLGIDPEQAYGREGDRPR